MVLSLWSLTYPRSGGTRRFWCGLNRRTRGLADWLLLQVPRPPPPSSFLVFYFGKCGRSPAGQQLSPLNIEAARKHRLTDTQMILVLFFLFGCIYLVRCVTYLENYHLKLDQSHRRDTFIQ